MKFLLDACTASRSMYEALTIPGHDVLSALDVMPDAPDDEVLLTALAEERMIITEDKDFGELVYVRCLAHPCIVHLTDMPTHEKVTMMCQIVERHAEAMREGSMIVVSHNRLRIRRDRHTEE